jgi:RhoGAP domain
MRNCPEQPPGGEDASQMLHISDPNTVAQLLKAYFRELPDPAIPFAIYPQVNDQ